MLRGTRIFTDDDIYNLMHEAIKLYQRIETNNTIPEELRCEVFRCVHIMLSTREQTQPLPDLGALRGMREN